MYKDFYKNKKVLVTGHTGFKGSWLSIWLLNLGVNVIGYALNPYTSKDNFVVTDLSHKMTDIRGDIRDFEKINSIRSLKCIESCSLAEAKEYFRIKDVSVSHEK